MGSQENLQSDLSVTDEWETDHSQKEVCGRKTASLGTFHACPSDSDHGWTMVEAFVGQLKERRQGVMTWTSCTHQECRKEIAILGETL